VELSWSTFVLEIINFLVLVWLLKHFLYQPVLDVIARRRRAIDEQLEQARTLEAQAQASRAEYEQRLANGERERGQALQALHREIESERTRRLQAVGEEVAKEREKQRARQEHVAAEAAARLEQQAMDNAASFASRLLGALSGPALEQGLIDLAIAQFETLPPDTLATLRGEAGQGPDEIVVSSAYPLDEPRRAALADKLAGLFPGCACRFEQQPELVAGLDIAAGAWRLGLNLRDELRGFARLGARA
jgi:F-type H+-transporting ATPase subunit b